ncbi:MAG: PQQ-dependent sugar dehydrogenase [Bacteroidota bacterium]|nr:PQQ-dependent sugar dehydrogenase [Bacteroidota bacterium]
MRIVKFFLKKTILLVAFVGISILLSNCNGNQSKVGLSRTAVLDSNSSEALFNKYKLDKIKLPQGFKISVYAEVPKAREMCVSPTGTVFVGTKGDKVYAIKDENHDGKTMKVYEIANGLTSPNGVAFEDGSLYIGAISTIYRLDSIESRLDNPPKPVVVYDQLPKDEHHGLRFIAFGPDGKLYVPVGAPCNICDPKPPYASLNRMNADGTDVEIFARGIRNTVGFDWNPLTKDIWFTDNGRDNLGDDIPNDELNTAPKSGMHFGYPYCHQGNIPDPEFGKGKNCSDYTAPAKLLGPHVAPLGLRFNTGSMFPSEYKNAIFIAEHGSWNRSIPIGYRVAVVKMDANGNAQDPEIFAQGWLQNIRDVSGRPVDVQFLQDGSMLVSDDFSGAIYRITYGK